MPIQVGWDKTDRRSDDFDFELQDLWRLVLIVGSVLTTEHSQQPVTGRDLT